MIKEKTAKLVRIINRYSYSASVRGNMSTNGIYYSVMVALITSPSDLPGTFRIDFRAPIIEQMLHILSHIIYDHRHL